MSHTFFNWLMPTWHALSMSGWGDARLNAVFVDCTGIGGNAGVEVEAAPSFVTEAAGALSTAPLRSLRRLLSPPPNRTAAHRLWRRIAGSQVTCFDAVLVGSQCSPLDHYQLSYPSSAMKAFREAVGRAVVGRARPQLAAAGVPLATVMGWTPLGGGGGGGAGGGGGGARGARVLLINRHEGRRILNEAALLTALRAVPGVGAVEVAIFGGPLHVQLALSAAAHVMIGMDGTGLHNANWLQPGAAVVYALPFGTDVLIPTKGDNFVRMWNALGVRSFRIDVTNRSDSVHPPEAYRLGHASPACLRCLEQLASSSDEVRLAVGACANVAKRVTYWYPCVLTQDQRLPVAAVTDAVQRAVKAQMG